MASRRASMHAIFLLTIVLVLTVGLGRRKLKSRIFRFTGTAIGNAFQAVHIFVDPGVRYVIAEKLEEEAEDDGEDDLADPAKHLERQLRRIRRGEQIERLTVRIREKE